MKSGRALTLSSAAPVRPSGALYSVAALAARWPPAEDPKTPMRWGSTPHSAACARTSRTARSTSSNGAGCCVRGDAILENEHRHADAVEPALHLRPFLVDRQARVAAARADDRRQPVRGSAGWGELGQRRDIDVVDPPILDVLFGRARLAQRHALGPKLDRHGRRRRRGCGWRWRRRGGAAGARRDGDGRGGEQSQRHSNGIPRSPPTRELNCHVANQITPAPPVSITRRARS